MARIWGTVLLTHRRQYVGLVRGGRRYVYGSFYPDSIDGPPSYVIEVVCDGGPTYFGVEFDLSRHAFTQLAFNGSV